MLSRRCSRIANSGLFCFADKPSANVPNVSTVLNTADLSGLVKNQVIYTIRMDFTMKLERSHILKLLLLDLIMKYQLLKDLLIKLELNL
jgi:hypothetical protein